MQGNPEHFGYVSLLVMHSGGFLGSAPLLVLVNRGTKSTKLNRGTKSQQGYKRPTGVQIHKTFNQRMLSDS